jgi:gas vesicle protein
MRFRTGLFVGAAIGFIIGRQLAPRDGEERSSGVRAAMSRHPSSQRLAGLANKAGTKSVEAIQRARASIQRRMVADPDDLSMN